MKNSFLIVISVIFTVSLCLVDFGTRLSLKDVNTADKNEALYKQTFSAVFFTDNEKLKLNKQLALFDVVTPVAKSTPKVKKKIPVKAKVTLLSEAQQQAQQGNLFGLYDNKFKYTLIATFDNNGKQFALIKEKNLLSQAIRKIRLFVGEQLSNYSLTQVKTNWIELVQDKRKVRLQLYLLKK